MTPAESMQSHISELSKDFVRLVEESNERHEEMMRALAATNAGFVELSREVERMIALFGTYVEETKGLRSEVREKLKLAANGAR
jgi:hypothetical protein